MNKTGIRKQYVVARYWRGSYVETMCKPMTKKEAETLCSNLSSKPDVLNKYEVKKIGSTTKKVTYL